ncbi:MAG: DUF362 domain-containing protein [Clostridia bacterium]|nr:DUF362 domain-containing protein [Clostridia bacterium]
MDTYRIKNAPVALAGCPDYDRDKVYDAVKWLLASIGAGKETFEGKKVVLKPNLVAAREPDAAVTSHPSVVEAVTRCVRECGAADVMIAESPGGSYTASFLNRIYDATGMRELAGNGGPRLNDDLSSASVKFAEGKKLKSFEVLTPIADADVVVNIPKLKTHSLTGLSCAVKNLFGVIPGTQKFAMHAAYPELGDFSEMLCDLDLALYRDHEIISVCDAVWSMEGNGPSHGTPVFTGMLLASSSTFALDVVAEHLAGLDGTTKFLDIAADKGLVARSADGVNVIRADGAPERAELAPPDSRDPNSFSMKILIAMPNLFGGRFSRFFEPSPKINAKKCVGCSNCAKVCPAKTITMKKKKGKKLAVIGRKNCIRCFCCQELCPHGAVDTVKNPILKLIG